MNAGQEQKERVLRTYSVLPFNRYVPAFRDQFAPFLRLCLPWWGQRSFALGKKENSKAKLLLLENWLMLLNPNLLWIVTIAAIEEEKDADGVCEM